MVRVTVPATTANLGPGYDCLGLALGLYTCVQFTPAAHWCLVVEGEGADELPRGRENLVWRAACRLWQHVNFSPPAFRVKIINSIPVGRGLGSSAAAIVAGLVAANHIAGFLLDRSGLLQLAAELEGHPDNVAPALLGGLTVSALDRGKVEAVRLDFPSHLRLVLCIPGFQLSTRRAREALPPTVGHSAAAFNVSRTALLLAALAQGRDDLLSLACQDRLHQPFRKQLVPGFDIAVQAAVDAGALACVLSGAGPSLLALVSGGDPHRVGKAMAAAFSAARYLVLAPDLTGARLQAV